MPPGRVPGACRRCPNLAPTTRRPVCQLRTNCLSPRVAGRVTRSGHGAVVGHLHGGCGAVHRQPRRRRVGQAALLHVLGTPGSSGVHPAIVHPANVNAWVARCIERHCAGACACVAAARSEGPRGRGARLTRGAAHASKETEDLTRHGAYRRCVHGGRTHTRRCSRPPCTRRRRRARRWRMTPARRVSNQALRSARHAEGCLCRRLCHRVLLPLAACATKRCTLNTVRGVLAPVICGGVLGTVV